MSGPARPAPARDAGRRAAPREQGLAARALTLLDALSSHRLLDRLIRGRLWIGIIAFALIGIVTLQLALLKLNSGIGHALEKQSSLQRSNAALSIEDSELAAGDRVESQAERLGMRLVAVGGLKFHSSSPKDDVARAAQALSATPKPAEHEAEAGAPASTAASSEKASSEAGETTHTTSEGSTEHSAGGEAAPSESAASGGSETSEPSSQGAPPTSESGGGGTAAPGG